MTDRSHRVYVTQWGEYRDADLPEGLRLALQGAAFRKDGSIDRRYARSRTAWLRLLVWSQSKYATGK